MVSVDLEKMSLEELKQLEEDVKKEIQTCEMRRKREAKAAVEAMAQEMGFSLAELVVGVNAVKGAPKYKHPDNPELTWSGKGRRPSWFIEALKAGMKADDLLV